MSTNKSMLAEISYKFSLSFWIFNYRKKNWNGKGLRMLKKKFLYSNMSIDSVDLIFSLFLSSKYNMLMAINNIYQFWSSHRKKYPNKKTKKKFQLFIIRHDQLQRQLIIKWNIFPFFASIFIEWWSANYRSIIW